MLHQSGPLSRQPQTLAFHEGPSHQILELLSYIVLYKRVILCPGQRDARSTLFLKSSVTPDTSSARRSGVMKASKPVDRGLRAQMNLPTRGYWELHYPGSSHFAVYLSLWLCVQLAEQKASAGPELERLYTSMAGRGVELYGTQGAYNVIASSR